MEMITKITRLRHPLILRNITHQDLQDLLEKQGKMAKMEKILEMEMEKGMEMGMEMEMVTPLRVCRLPINVGQDVQVVQNVTGLLT